MVKEWTTVAILVLFSTPALSGELDWSPSELISGPWRCAEANTVLNIQENGGFEVVSENGGVLLSGHIEVLTWEHLDQFPQSLVDAVIFGISIEDHQWRVPGCYIWGEGDPPGLELLLRSLPKSLKGFLGTKANNGTLWLSGKGPGG